jgi:hypothetical protein
MRRSPPTWSTPRRADWTGPHAAEVDDYVRTHWRPDRLQAADLIAALGAWRIRRQVLTHGQIARAIRRLPEWWARSELVAALIPRLVGRKRTKALLTDKLSDPVSDVAIAATVQLVRAGGAMLAGWHTIRGRPGA